MRSAIATPLVNVRNDAWTISPFVGGVRKLSDQLFVQGFGQVDFDTGGNQLDIVSTLIGIPDLRRLKAAGFPEADVEVLGRQLG